tara:strand:+ start:834 stop:1616 length:783 start_codon:yes stop_codon:yes gene_type:complete
MPVSVDTVYQRVLALANKEQRGYIPPVKFNLFANQAQMDIFEQYFYDRAQFGRRNGNQTVVADPIDILQEKIANFQMYDKVATVLGNFGDVNLNDDFDNFYRLEMVRVSYEKVQGFRKAEHVELKDLSNVGLSPLLDWSQNYPIYTHYTAGGNFDRNRIKVYPYPRVSTLINPLTNKPFDRVLVSYIRTPKKVEWNGVDIGGTPNPVYNSDLSSDFDLHGSEETKLVIKILQLAAIAMKDNNLLSIASQEDIKNIQQEKQ